ncbi:unnamed protein product [Camellia sinensis]
MALLLWKQTRMYSYLLSKLHCEILCLFSRRIWRFVMERLKIDGKEGRNTTRSIWSAKYFLEAALHWHIGNGRSMKIWKDIWIPRPYSYKPISVTKFLHADAKL